MKNLTTVQCAPLCNSILRLNSPPAAPGSSASRPPAAKKLAIYVDELSTQQASMTWKYRTDQLAHGVF